MSALSREDSWVRCSTMAMAGLATIGLEQAMLEPGQSRALALVLTTGLFIVPGVAAAWLLARYQISPAGRAPGSDESHARPATGIALVTLFTLPFIWELGSMVLTGRSVMLEVTLMAALRNLGLGLATMAHWRVYARLSAFVSLFLVTVASSVGGEGGMPVLAPVGGFALVGTLWLIMVYWEGLGLEVERWGRGPATALSRAAWVLLIAGVFAAVAAVGPSRATSMRALFCNPNRPAMIACSSTAAPNSARTRGPCSRIYVSPAA